MSTPPQIPTQRQGLLGSLFDTSFTTLVAPRVIRALYILVLALILIALSGFLIASIASGGVAEILVALIVGPLVALLWVVYARVLLEVIIAIFRLLESSRELVHLQRRQVGMLQQQLGHVPPPIVGVPSPGDPPGAGPGDEPPPAVA